MKQTIKMALGLAFIASLAACSEDMTPLDVVGQHSITSFSDVLKTIPDRLSADTSSAGWALSAPDGSVRFIWSGNDIMLEMDAEPFLKAGLDPQKLPGNYAYEMEGKKLKVGKKLGKDGKNGKDGADGNATALSAYARIVSAHRDEINYHSTLDHYGVKLGDGNMFEWAKDMKTNGYDNSRQDKDIVFVLNPEPLIAAGVDPKKVEAWVYAPVPIEENGKPIMVWKLLKPFDLK